MIYVHAIFTCSLSLIDAVYSIRRRGFHRSACRGRHARLAGICVEGTFRFTDYEFEGSYACCRGACSQIGNSHAGNCTLEANIAGGADGDKTADEAGTRRNYWGWFGGGCNDT